MTDLVELLKSYELAREQTACSVGDFLRSNGLIVGSEEQLALIDLDMRLQMAQGKPPLLRDYTVDFPHFEDSLPAMLEHKVEEFLRAFCPVGERVGPLPQPIPSRSQSFFKAQDSYGQIADHVLNRSQ